MQVHTFISDSANEAVEQIRSELGPSAVVLSVRKLPGSGISRLWSGGQIEVVAGVPEETPVEQEPAPSPAADPLELLRQEIRELKQKLHSPESQAVPTQAVTRSSPADGAAGKFLVQTGLLPLYAEQIEEQIIQEHGAIPRDLPGQLAAARNALGKRWRSSSLAGLSKIHFFRGAARIGEEHGAV